MGSKESSGGVLPAAKNNHGSQSHVVRPEGIDIFTVVMGADYLKMVEAMRRSVRRNFPEANLIIKEVAVPRDSGVPRAYACNRLKSEMWCDAVQESERRLILMDADTIVLRPLRQVFRNNFDIGLTQQSPDAVYSVNAGVVFTRPTDVARRFFDQWHANTEYVYKQKSQRAQRSGGVQQAGLKMTLGGLRLDKDPMLDDIRMLPCWRWNCGRWAWGQFEPQKTAVVHVQPPLRGELLKVKGPRRLHRAQVVLEACRRYYGV